MQYTEPLKKELLNSCPLSRKEADFDAFWEKTIEQAKKTELLPMRKDYPYPSPYIKAFSISYNGFDDTRIHGVFVLPVFAGSGKLPCLIHYHGYTGNAGIPADYMDWVSMGVSVLAVDCRDQSGKTGNAAKYSSGSTQSAVCKGVLDKNEYYYRAVYMDCLKAIDFAVAQPEVDPEQIIIEGGSQGGALGLAVCALDNRPILCMVDVPSNCQIDKRIEGANGSYSAVAEYLRIHPNHTDEVLKTLSYFDNVNLADKIKCSVLASVGLKDTVCPPKMFFAAYNRILSKKEVCLYPFNGHEGGGAVHREIKMRTLREILDTVKK